MDPNQNNQNQKSVNNKPDHPAYVRASAQKPPLPKPVNDPEAIKRLNELAEKEKGKYIIEQEIAKRRENSELSNKLPSNQGELINTEEKKFLKIFPADGWKGWAVKIGLVSGIFLMSVFIISVLTFFTGLDTYFFKITLEAAVVTSETEPIPNANIIINEEIVTSTNENGIFILKNLEPGRINIRIDADGYFPLEEEVSIGRGLFDYNIEKIFRLETGNTASISGRLAIPETDFHTFENDVLLVNDENFSINPDGNYEILGIAAGEIILEYKSTRYEDFRKQATIAPGNNQIAEVALVPSGDIIGNITSFVREDIPEDITFSIDTVPTNNIDINTQAGEFSILDLNINRSYTLRIEASGYETREYEVAVSQGENIIPNIAIVESGKTVFAARTEDDSTTHIYISSLDGANRTRLSSERFNPTRLYFDESSNEVFFSSNANRIAAQPSGRYDGPYRLDLDSSTLSPIISGDDDTGILYPNYAARAFLEAYNDDNLEIQIRNFNGSVTDIIRTIPSRTLIDGVLSDNKKYAYVVEEDSESGTKYLIAIDIENRVSRILEEDVDAVSIESVSATGNRVLYKTSATSASFEDLFLYDFNRTEKRSLVTNARGNEYQFISDSETEYIFWEQREGNTNIYSLNTENNESTRYTTLTGSQKITAMYQQSGYVFYITNSGLYILDLQAPHNFKQVLQSTTIVDIR